MDPLIVLMMAILRVYCVETPWDSSARVIRRVAVADVTAAAQAGLIWLGVHVVVVGWMLVGFGFHATSKGVGLSCELDYAISFWSWIL